MVIFWMAVLLAYGSGSFYAGAKYGRKAEADVQAEIAKLKAEVKSKL